MTTDRAIFSVMTRAKPPEDSSTPADGRLSFDRSSRPCPGFFVVGTDTGVGKTYVAARIAASIARAGHPVGVYKPAASGCREEGGQLISDDAMALWEGAGRPGSLDAVCPQRFRAPLAPHLAARAEGREIDRALLRAGIGYWLTRSEVVIAEGAGGLMSPIGDDDYVADVAADLGLPLIVVAPNRIGVINQVLQTLIAAESYGGRLSVCGIVLSDVLPHDANDPSVESNRRELERRCKAPVLASLAHGANDFDPAVDWHGLACKAGEPNR
jgi:dethiobiotin synthetase